MARKKAVNMENNEEGKVPANSDLTEQVAEVPEQPTKDETPVQPVDADKGVQLVQVHHDETDVPAALERETQDGKGDDEVPPSDFVAFATEGVENEENK